MAVELVTVTGNLETLIGATPSNGRFWFKLARPDWNADGDIFAPEYVEAVAASDGSFSIALQSTDDFESAANYSAVLRYRDTVSGTDREYTVGFFALPAPGPHQLADLLTAGAPPAPTSYWRAITEAEYDACIDAEDSAAASSALAEKWATENEDVPVTTGKFSARHWALKAAAAVGSGILNAIAALTTTGLIARTGTGTVATRTITVTPGAGLVIANGNGVAGNPTLALDLVTTNTRLVGGFGALAAGDATDDWNAPENARNGMGAKLLPGNAINGPNGLGHFYHSLSFEYSTINYLTQFAIPYNAVASDSFVGTIYYRSKQGTWGTWRALASDANILSLLTYATQAEAEAGSATDKPMNALRVRQASVLGYASSLSANGYIKLPTWLGGMIIQWGSATCTGDSNSTAITWPITFPTACLQAVASQNGDFNVAADAGAGIFGLTTTGANLRNGANVTTALRYIAIGY